ncbi:YpmS family protein [Oceanobacillus sp. CAU 1775]
MSKTSRREKNSNKWKGFFYLLLGVNIAVILVIISLIFWPVEEVTSPFEDIDFEEDSSEFTVRTTKKNLNELINAYIAQWTSGTGLHYRVELNDDVHLIGEFPVFSTTVPFSVHFEPLVADNGDIILKQRSISLGLLELPNKKIMEYLARYLPMPEWVVVNPDDEEIFIAVSQMDIKSNFRIAVETIDLEANNLAFRISVPYGTLGIDYLEAENE